MRITSRKYCLYIGNMQEPFSVISLMRFESFLYKKWNGKHPSQPSHFHLFTIKTTFPIGFTCGFVEKEWKILNQSNTINRGKQARFFVIRRRSFCGKWQIKCKYKCDKRFDPNCIPVVFSHLHLSCYLTFPSCLPIFSSPVKFRIDFFTVCEIVIRLHIVCRDVHILFKSIYVITYIKWLEMNVLSLNPFHQKSSHDFFLLSRNHRIFILLILFIDILVRIIVVILCRS